MGSGEKILTAESHFLVDGLEAALWSLLPQGARLVLGISGGRDSMVLLDGLRVRFSADLLLVAHLDHQIRPKSAETAQFVTQCAQARGLAHHIGHADVPKLAREQQLSLETAARQARYRFLDEVATMWGARFVVVAHHADDQAETVLHHLLRGTGLRGLGGMRAQAPLPFSADGKQLLRPLLPLTRAQLAAYAHTQKLSWHEDESNADTQYRRNRLRHVVLPVLQGEEPHLVAHLRDLAEIADAEDSYLAEQGRQSAEKLRLEKGTGWATYDGVGLRALPLALQRRVLHQLLREGEGEGVQEIGFAHVEGVRHFLATAQVGQRYPAPGVTVEQGYGGLFRFFWADVRPIFALPQLQSAEPQLLPVPGRIVLAQQWVITSEPVTLAEARAECQKGERWQAIVATEQPLWVRGRVAGEHFQPFGGQGHHQSVKKMMIEARIPAELRRLWPLVATAHHLLWVAGHRLDQRASVLVEEDRPMIRLTCSLRAFPDEPSSAR